MTDDPRDTVAALAELAARLGATTGLDAVVDAVLDGLCDLFGHEHSLLLLHDEHTGALYTLASHGYDMEGIGSEVHMGEGIIGMVAAQRAPMRIANLQRMLAYARSVRRSTEERQGEILGAEIPLPGLKDAQSQLAVPMLSRATLVGVIAVESARPLVFDEVDERVLTVVGQLAGEAIEVERALAGDRDPEEPGAPSPGQSVPAARPPAPTTGHTSRLRHYEVDGSTFLNEAYLIKGVAGRLLWKLAREHVESGRTEFTNREARLDPALQLPPFRDNFESRLILLKRRLDEREATVRIESTGRGRFRLILDGALELARVD